MFVGKLGFEPKRIAVVRALRGLGDLLCVVPALRTLRSALPQARVTLVGLPQAEWMLERYPGYLDELLEFPGYPGIPEAQFDPARLADFLTRVQGRFDLALQFHGSGTNSNAFALLLGARKTAGLFLPALGRPEPELFMAYPAHGHEIHHWTSLLEFLGLPSSGDHLEFPVREADRRHLAELWQPPGRYVCIHPGATEPVRRWPTERFAAAGDELARRGYSVVLTGSEAEASLTAEVAASMTADAVDLAGRTDLGSLAALLERASVLVCNDTGVSHLAAAISTPSVVVFSASDPGRWAPLDRRLHRVAGTVMPERKNACRHTAEVKGHRCLRDACSSLVVPNQEEWEPASVAEVVAKADALLGMSR